MNKSKTAKAIALVVTGATLSLGMVSTVSAHEMYNTGVSNRVDGWTFSGGIGGSGTQNPWLGTPNNGGDLPFGYAGAAPLNWAVKIHHAGQVSTVSAAQAALDYNGAIVDIDTGSGAWGAGSTGNAPLVSQGNGHHVDFALFKSEIETDVILNISSEGGAAENFGMTVFTGMETSVGGYSIHQAWNVLYTSVSNEAPAQVDNPFSGAGLTYLTHGDNGRVQFHMAASQVYTIVLGGNTVGSAPFDSPVGYQVIVSAVPIPAAAWLFGTGILGLMSLGRVKQETV